METLFAARQYVHIIEHPTRGALWGLMNGLSVYDNHVVLETKGLFIPLSQSKENTTFVFHTCGKSYPMIDSLPIFLNQGLCCSVFVHVLPDYILLKGLSSFLAFIADIQKRYGIRILVPSISAASMFRKYGIQCVVVNLGISLVELSNHNHALNRYYNRIVTVSTNNTEHYLYAKGIDLFARLVCDCGVEKQSLILGANVKNDLGIESARLSHSDFLSVLSHARVYVQLSRSESYNISAIEAKQLKVPLLVSDVAGHLDSVRNANSRAISYNDAKEKLTTILANPDTIKTIVNDNYEDSIIHESVEAFRKRLEIAMN